MLLTMKLIDAVEAPKQSVLVAVIITLKHKRKKKKKCISSNVSWIFFPLKNVHVCVGILNIVE